MFGKLYKIYYNGEWIYGNTVLDSSTGNIWMAYTDDNYMIVDINPNPIPRRKVNILESSNYIDKNGTRIYDCDVLYDHKSDSYLVARASINIEKLIEVKLFKLEDLEKLTPHVLNIYSGGYLSNEKYAELKDNIEIIGNTIEKSLEEIKSYVRI